jgi:predicted metal-dependent enzyme (double-stranded beta helix superfamily)
MSNTLARFVAQFNRLPIAAGAAIEVQTDALTTLRAFARHVSLEPTDIAPNASRYIARPLHRDPAGWSLAVVVLTPGQATLPHDHEAWGCATTIWGIERVRRFTAHTGRRLDLIEEREVPRGDGYTFDRDEIHQVIGAEGRHPTIALHLLVQGTALDRARQRFPERLPPDGWRVPLASVRLYPTARADGECDSRRADAA